MFKKLIENQKQKKLETFMNKPEFKLGDLYVGEIVLFKKTKYVGSGINNNYYYTVKKFAFFTKDYLDYTHIKSNQVLQEMGAYSSIPGDYAIIDVKTFQEAFPVYMRKNNLTPTSKVSRAFIEKSEDNLNQELAPDQKVCDLFR